MSQLRGIGGAGECEIAESRCFFLHTQILDKRPHLLRRSTSRDLFGILRERVRVQKDIFINLERQRMRLFDHQEVARSIIKSESNQRHGGMEPSVCASLARKRKKSDVNLPSAATLCATYRGQFRIKVFHVLVTIHESQILYRETSHEGYLASSARESLRSY